ncbi:manganese efflux pump MntP family protein [Desulfurispira natronophila]|uniref:Putative Mn2+ efflux pump MntP n=1 Tax=Desulfurispira natronophila TaxID=682562 RepID=A0A7W7Y348_9BACT|nr:manganese efflux pump [Desulfurispira natronophila]MBB5021230.1 putative Mn2+ efflux pump MntP [Desulfurispira natronophila]
MLTGMLVLGLVVASNNFAVAIGLGAMGHGLHRWRIAVVFGFFEFLAPLLGLWAGHEMSTMLHQRGPWLAAPLLAALGLWAVWDAFIASQHDWQRKERFYHRALISWVGLVVLAVILSVDNLLVGFSLGVNVVASLSLAAYISLFTVLFTLLGLYIGSACRHHWEKAAQVLSGLLFIGLGMYLWGG